MLVTYKIYVTQQKRQGLKVGIKKDLGGLLKLPRSFYSVMMVTGLTAQA